MLARRSPVVFCRAALQSRAGFTIRTMSNEALVLCDTVDNIRLIGINRPKKRNAVNRAVATQLVNAFEQFNNDSSVDVAVFHGKGGVFCAGYDLAEVSKGDGLADIDGEFIRKNRPMGPTKMRFEKPVIAAIDGFAVAGGLELALMCDLRVVEQSAILGVFCRRYGVPLIDGGTIRLPRLIGMSRAMDMILTGRPIDSATALQWGLANRRVADGTALDSAIALAKEIAKFPQKCMLVDRASAHYSAYDAKSMEDAFHFELEKGIKVVKEESTHGAQRFVDGIGRHGIFDRPSKL